LTEKWFTLWLLYCLPLLLKVWQRSGSCSCCYIFYHYCLWFDRRVVDVVVVIFSTSSAYDLTEKWFTLLLYFLPLLFKVWQRSSSNCGCYIVNYYCLRFDKEWFMLLLLYCLPLLFMVWQRSGSPWGCYNVYHYCLKFDRRVVHVFDVILSTITI
jgi:hypothetical protein